MKVDQKAIIQQFKNCKEVLEIIAAANKKLTSQYNAVGSVFSDNKYSELGEIIGECKYSLMKTASELSGVIEKLNQISFALAEYESVSFSGGSGGSYGSGNETANAVNSSETQSGITGPDEIMEAGLNWSDQLSEEETSALREYTGSAYYNINASLRGKADFTPQNRNRAIRIHEALGRAQIPNDCVVYRGASNDALGSFRHLSDSELVGHVIRDAGFMSTCLRNEDSFMGDIQLEISVPAGAHGAYLGYISAFGHNESEVLFDAGQILEITGVRRDERGQRIISTRMLV